MGSKNFKDLLGELIKTNFKLRYNNSFLGFVWVLIKPFAQFVILYMVWTAFKGQNVENYQVNLLLGIILFTYVNEGIIIGMNGLLDKAHIILKVNFPREIAVMSSVSMALINLSVNLVIFLVFSIFNPVNFTLVGLLWFVLVIIISISIIYGVDLFLSILLIKLRDLQHIFELIFQLLFWLTPIFYQIGSEPGEIGGTVGRIVSLNPVGILITISRGALINGRIVDVVIWNTQISSVWIILIALLFSIITIISGRLFFKSEVKKIAEYF